MTTAGASHVWICIKVLARVKGARCLATFRDAKVDPMRLCLVYGKNSGCKKTNMERVERI